LLRKKRIPGARKSNATNTTITPLKNERVLFMILVVVVVCGFLSYKLEVCVKRHSVHESLE
jgi:hypothetical protein